MVEAYAKGTIVKACKAGGWVNLAFKMLRDSHVPALLEAVEEYKVERLYLYNNQFGVDGARALAAGLAANKTLIELSLNGDKIGGSGEAFGEALKANSSLKELNMDGCSLGPEDGKGLAAGLAANTTLETLDVEYNKLGDEGKAALQEAVRGREGFELRV